MSTRQATHEPPNQSSLLIRLGRICIYGILGLVIVILLAFSAAAIYLYQNQESLSQEIAAKIKNRTGIEASFSAVDVALFPIPSLAISDISLQFEQAKLNIAYATASPVLWSLLQGKVVLGHISLIRPYISGELPKNVTENNAPPHEVKIFEDTHDIINKALDSVTIPPVLHGCDIKIAHGSVDFALGDSKIVMEDIQIDLDISLNGTLRTDIAINSPSTFKHDETMTQVDALQLSISGLTNAENLRMLKLNLGTRLHIDKLLKNTNINFDFSLQPDVEMGTTEGSSPHLKHILTGKWNIDGSLLWHDVAIPMASSGDLSGDLDTSIDITQASAQLGDDSLSLQAQLNNIFSNDPSISGSIDLKHLSLTQWFGFARNLPPGLQHTLKDISDGKLDFEMNKNWLKVPHIEATAAKTTFVGTGGVASWDDIIIKLDLSGPDVSLVTAFPETEGVDVSVPSFPHRPLTPMPGTSEAAASTGPSVGYDINLNVEKLTTWGLTLGDVSFRAIPAEEVAKSNPKNHPDAVLLDFTIDKFYGGKTKAKALLFRTKDKISGYDITAIFRNVNAKGPLDILAGREILGGKLSLDTSFVAYGKNLGEFLISKVGELSLNVDGGFFTGKSKQRTSFENFHVAGKFTSTPLTTKMSNSMPASLRYNGLWKVALQRPDLHLESNLNGILTLVGKDYTDIVLDNISGKLQATLGAKSIGLKQDILADISGKYSFDSAKSTLSAAKAQMLIPNFANTSLNGNFSMDYAKELQWEANLKGHTKNLSVLAEKLSSEHKSPIPATAPQELKIQAKLTKNDKGLNISNLWLSLDKMKLSGNIHKSADQKPLWNINLKLNLLDLDKLFPTQKATTSTPSTVTTKPSKPWSLAWLNENNAKGQIQIEILRLHKTTSTNINIPIKMENNTLTLSPIRGTFYGGPAKVDFVGKGVGNVLHVQGGISAENIKMLELSHELKLKTAIGGSGSVWVSAKGALTNSNTILPLLDGTWRVKIAKGFFQTRRDDGTLTGESTTFEELRDSGPLSNGILYSKNLALLGPDLSLTGSGTIDIVKNTLDMRLLASTSGLNDIPVHYYGSLDDPQRDINTGSVILGAITNFGTGIFDLLGGALEGLFGIFKN